MPKSIPKYPPKRADLHSEVRRAVEEGRYRYTAHGALRLDQRVVQQGILETDVVYVLKQGHREPRKDLWSELHQTWTYAMRGKTLDGIAQRVCVAFERMPDQTLMIIVTVINLDLKE